MDTFDPWDNQHLARVIARAKSILGHAEGRWEQACDEALLVLQGATDDEIATLRKGVS